MEALKDSDWKVRKNAAESLGFFAAARRKAVPGLLALLKDDQVKVRQSALLSLGRLGKGNPKVEAALEEFTKDPDTSVREDAVIALAALGKTDDSALPVLIKALASKEKATAKSAVQALAIVGRKTPEKVLPSMIEMLKKKDGGEQNALGVLQKMRTAAEPALPTITALYASADPATRLDIMDAVVAIDKAGDQAIPILIKQLKAVDPIDRREALFGLMHYRTRAKDWTEAVAGVLNDRDREVKMMAIGVLKGTANHSKEIALQLAPLTQDPELPVRRAAIRALGTFKPLPHEALAALEKCLKDQNPSIRTLAALQLGYIGREYPAEVTKMLESALSSEQFEPTKRAISTALRRVPKPSPSSPGGKQSSAPSPKESATQ